MARRLGPAAVGHDVSHLDRVFRLAMGIREQEGGDALVIAAAAYLHDCHRIVEGQVGRRVGAEEAAGAALAVATGSSLPAQRLDAVLECIAFTGRHRFAGHELGQPSVEAKIVRDADNLDALGAIGIARAFMYGGWLEEPPWVPELPLADVYRPGRATSVVHHVHEKLLKLKDDMLTPTARTEAEARHAFLEEFLDRFLREWSGELGGPPQR